MVGRWWGLVLALLVSGCSGNEPTVLQGGGGTGNGSGGNVGNLRGGDIDVPEGDFTEGSAPSTTADAGLTVEIVSVTGPAAATNGGTAILHVQLSASVAAPLFYVRLVGGTGFHTITGLDPDGDDVYEIGVHVAAEAEQTSLVLEVALTDGMGDTGPYHSVEIELVPSGTGDVKVTLSFDRLHDLDLHVIEPSGDEIFHERPSSSSGGKLDLDSGANCEPSAANSENIFWPPGGAPSGEYRVSVHNYQQCTPGAIPFTVRVAYDGVLETYEGSFADATAGEMMTTTNVAQVVTFRRPP